MADERRFFFDTDDSCHWYSIPLELRGKWIELKTATYEDDEAEQSAQEEFELLFEEYRLPMHPSNFSFVDVQDI